MTEADRKEIERLRLAIDNCDEQIFKALRTRCSLSYLIGLRKHSNNLPIVNNDRFTKIVDDKIKTFTTEFLTEANIRDLYDVIHEHSCKIQQKYGTNSRSNQ